jgi:hypothetical protein
MNKKTDDGYSGYRPDMDQYSNVNDEVDASYRMIGTVILAFMAFVGIIAIVVIFRWIAGWF